MSPDDFEKFASAFLENLGMEQDASYIQRGRRFSTLADAELVARWVAAFRTYVAGLLSGANSAESNDLASELTLRGKKPYDLVKDEHQILVLLAKKIIDSLSSELREEEFDEQLAKGIANFARDLDVQRG